MNLKRIFSRCLSGIGEKENKDVHWYLYERPKRISRNNFFKEVGSTIWTSGFGWKKAETILKRAEEKGFVQDYTVVSSWDGQHLNELIGAVHGRPIPELARKKWEAIYEVAKKVNTFSTEEDFRKSFFGGKVASADLDGSDVQRLSNLRLPFIREANAQHIIRNMGGEVIKCDRWISAFLEHYKISLSELESKLREINIPLGFFDLVVWAYCEKFVKKVSRFNEHFNRVFNSNIGSSPFRPKVP